MAERTAATSRIRLLELARTFDRDPAGHRRLMRQHLENQRQLFLHGAVELVRTQVDSGAAQCAIGILVGSGLLLSVLCDPAISREQALAIARAAVRIDSMTDVALARSLAETVLSSDGSADITQAVRVMEILDDISDGARILPLLIRLLRHSNPYLRSKAVLMIGRGNRSAKWVRQRLAEADPRIRANAIEALWGVASEDARDLLQFMVRDPNNRVVGNAIIGLYRLGDPSMIPEILRLARHDSAVFRATAAWVMGETGDARFSETVAGMLRDGNTTVRKRAFAALGRIKSASSEINRAPACLITGLPVDTGDADSRKLQIAVQMKSGRQSGLLATEFILSENGKAITDYRVDERALPETMSIVFLVPGSNRSGAQWTDAVLQCLPGKRNSDLWSCLHYFGSAPDGTLPGLKQSEDPPRFHSTAEAITAHFSRAPVRSERGDLWHTIWRAVRMDRGPLAGKRHLIVFNEDGASGVPDDGLVSAVLGSHASVQVVSLVPSVGLERLCERVDGRLHRVESPDDIPALIAEVYLRLFVRYEVTYKPICPDAAGVRVRVRSLSGCGEAVIPLPAPE